MSDEARPPDSLDEAPPVVDELSEAEVDALIREKNPEFAKELEALSDEKFVVQEISEAKPSKTRQKIEIWFDRIKAKIIAYGLRFVIFCKTKGKDAVIRFAKNIFLKLKAALTAVFTAFAQLSGLRKAALVGLLALSVAIGWLVNKARLGQIVPESVPLFATSMQDFADKTYSWDRQEKSIKFYESSAIRSQLHLMKKITVNLKRLPTTEGKNPMGVFEFFIEGLSADSLIEIKENESRIRDFLSRRIEEFSVEELQTGAGKKELLEKLRDSLNAELKTGLVKQLYYKNIILNPY
jgi:flagellar basal body-associated protein FliL